MPAKLLPTHPAAPALVQTPGTPSVRAATPAPPAVPAGEAAGRTSAMAADGLRESWSRLLALACYAGGRPLSRQHGRGLCGLLGSDACLRCRGRGRGLLTSVDCHLCRSSAWTQRVFSRRLSASAAGTVPAHLLRHVRAVCLPTPDTRLRCMDCPSTWWRSSSFVAGSVHGTKRALWPSCWRAARSTHWPSACIQDSRVVWCCCCSSSPIRTSCWDGSSLQESGLACCS